MALARTERGDTNPTNTSHKKHIARNDKRNGVIEIENICKNCDETQQKYVIKFTRTTTIEYFIFLGKNKLNNRHCYIITVVPAKHKDILQVFLTSFKNKRRMPPSSRKRYKILLQ